MNNDLISKTEFIQALKNYRAKHHFTQVEAAEKLEMSVRSLQNWEIARSMPRGFALVALLKAIGFLPAKSPKPTASIAKSQKKVKKGISTTTKRVVKKEPEAAAPKSLSTHLL